MPSTTDPRALLLDLLERRSLTPEDAGCCLIIGERLKALGFDIEWMNHEGVTNLWATYGMTTLADRPLLVFAGHTDVVPPGPLDQWDSDPFVPDERDGKIYARGAADMKSGLSAMICATETLFAEQPPRLRLGFLITSDEEGPCRHGTRHVVQILQRRQITPDYTIVGEATASESVGDRVINGRRGSLNCGLRVLGVQGHVAYPTRADNPIHRALPALAELVATRWDEGNEDFPATSFQISNLTAGTGVSNVIPGHAELQFDFRYAPVVTADELRERVESILDRHGIRYSADWTHSGSPYYTADGNLLRALDAAIQTCGGAAPERFTGGGTSDGRFIAPLGGEVVEMGPVSASIHKVNECVSITDLLGLTAMYAEVIRQLDN